MFVELETGCGRFVSREVGNTIARHAQSQNIGLAGVVMPLAMPRVESDQRPEIQLGSP